MNSSEWKVSAIATPVGGGGGDLWEESRKDVFYSILWAVRGCQDALSNAMMSWTLDSNVGLTRLIAGLAAVLRDLHSLSQRDEFLRDGKLPSVRREDYADDQDGK